MFEVEYRLLAEGRLLNGDGAPPEPEVEAPGAVTASEGRGMSLNTISAKESMLAERCRALLSLRLQRDKNKQKAKSGNTRSKSMGFWWGLWARGLDLGTSANLQSIVITSRCRTF